MGVLFVVVCLWGVCLFVFNIMSVMCIYLYYDGKETGDRFKNECKENREKGCDCGTSKAGGDQKSPESMRDEKAES